MSCCIELGVAFSTFLPFQPMVRTCTNFLSFLTSMPEPFHADSRSIFLLQRQCCPDSSALSQANASPDAIPLRALQAAELPQTPFTHELPKTPCTLPRATTSTALQVTATYLKHHYIHHEAPGALGEAAPPRALQAAERARHGGEPAQPAEPPADAAGAGAALQPRGGARRPRAPALPRTGRHVKCYKRLHCGC